MPARRSASSAVLRGGAFSPALILPRVYLIRYASRFLPLASSAASHSGKRPRPAHNSPLGPRYFGATLPRLRLLAGVAALPAGRPLRRGAASPPSSLESPSIWFCNAAFSAVTFSARAAWTRSRSAANSATDIFFRLSLAKTFSPLGLSRSIKEEVMSQNARRRHGQTCDKACSSDASDASLPVWR